MKGLDFQIGEKVKWKTGNVTNKGCFLEDNGDGTASIIVHHIGNQPSGIEINVDKKLLKLNI